MKQPNEIKQYKEPSMLKIVRIPPEVKTNPRFRDMERGDIYLRDGAVSMCVENSDTLLNCNLQTGRVWAISGSDEVILISSATLTVDLQS